eukprot:4224287-Amphidinium_carterae.1
MGLSPKLLVEEPVLTASLLQGQGIKLQQLIPPQPSTYAIAHRQANFRRVCGPPFRILELHVQMKHLHSAMAS